MDREGAAGGLLALWGDGDLAECPMRLQVGIIAKVVTKVCSGEFTNVGNHQLRSLSMPLVAVLDAAGGEDDALRRDAAGGVTDAAGGAVCSSAGEGDGRLVPTPPGWARSGRGIAVVDWWRSSPRC